MYKIAISGKVNSGKSTLSHLLFKNLCDEKLCGKKKILQSKIYSFAFADHLKEIILSTFPEAQRKFLYGPSELRQNIIHHKYKDADGNFLTYRKALTDFGQLLRSYNPNFFVDKFYITYNQYKETDLFIVSDVRFLNEFIALNNENFYSIRIKRKTNIKINDVSETQQDEISDDKFNIVINNDFSLEVLENTIKSIISDKLLL